MVMHRGVAVAECRAIKGGEQRTMRFLDRHDAGRQLAERLERYQDTDAIVLALPRGGVPVGYEVARTLAAPLDVLVARKLGAPGQPELGIGAIAPGGILVMSSQAPRVPGVTPEYVEDVTRRETIEMQRRMRLYRSNRPAVNLQGRAVILVDDGLATGVTALAAVRSVRQQGAHCVVFAAPVCASQAIHTLVPELDHVLYVHAPDDMRAIGLWYDNFRQTTDEEVQRLLGLDG